ncbi:MAG: flagellar biosynthesis protein FlgN [Treponema sp.]|nr:flagellar biosynthesis protein FlgN [Treponema sp.]
MAAAKQTPISGEELAQRVAILRRFRELLVQQRERFSRYLITLEKQQAVIETGSSGELAEYIEQEQQIITDILSIQKVIDPLEEMYNAAIPVSSAGDVPALKTALKELKEQVAVRSAHNRELLSARMDVIRSEIIEMRNNPLANAARSTYGQSGTASLIDIEG